MWIGNMPSWSVCRLRWNRMKPIMYLLPYVDEMGNRIEQLARDDVLAS